MATVEFKNVDKIYEKNVQAVFDFNLKVKDKEFIVLVGPSGCGKSTTLRMLAGLEEISNGEILIDGKVVNNIQPKDRDIAMVFQNYALYPHMTVYDNMAFGLKIKHLPKKEIDKKVYEAAEILGLETYLDRKPKALSGGQRQRVALGRAIVRTPKVFLMDEPLSNLDAKLRVQMRSEIIKIHKKVNATTVYVTHDQTEAMTMASRIVIMRDGVIQQIGTPKEVYSNPSNVFVAGFIGNPATNFLYGTVKKDTFVVEPANKGDKPTNIKISAATANAIKKHFDSKLIELNSSLKNRNDELTAAGKTDEEIQKDEKCIELETKIKNLKSTNSKETYKVILGVRPENIKINETQKGYSASLDCKCDIAELLGHELIVYTFISGQRIIAKIDSTKEVNSDDKIKIAFKEDTIHYFDGESELKII